VLAPKTCTKHEYLVLHFPASATRDEKYQRHENTEEIPRTLTSLQTSPIYRSIKADIVSHYTQNAGSQEPQIGREKFENSVRTSMLQNSISIERKNSKPSGIQDSKYASFNRKHSTVRSSFNDTISPTRITSNTHLQFSRNIFPHAKTSHITKCKDPHPLHKNGDIPNKVNEPQFKALSMRRKTLANCNNWVLEKPGLHKIRKTKKSRNLGDS